MGSPNHGTLRVTRYTRTTGRFASPATREPWDAARCALHIIICAHRGGDRALGMGHDLYDQKARASRTSALVLRANDKRIPDDNAQGLVRLDAGRVRTWCAPVVIDYPGVSLDEAADLLGVNRTTVARWASPRGQTWWQAVQAQMRETGEDPRFGRPSLYRVFGQRLILEHDYNRANPKRSSTRVWARLREGIDPSGAVWSADQTLCRADWLARVSLGFSQQLRRVDRDLSGRPSGLQDRHRIATRVMQWACPVEVAGCGRRVYKLFLPIGGAAFVCHRCAGLAYESADRRLLRRKRGKA